MKNDVIFLESRRACAIVAESGGSKIAVNEDRDASDRLRAVCGPTHTYLRTSRLKHRVVHDLVGIPVLRLNLRDDIFYALTVFRIGYRFQ